MVLTNSIFFKAFWEEPFDPQYTFPSTFIREDGTETSVPLMYYQSAELASYTEMDGFQVLEMPYEGQNTSMVILLPQDGHSTDDLSPETLAKVNNWLDSSPEPVNECGVDIHLPKFRSTVSSTLAPVLKGMGMPHAFGAADFSGMTDAAVYINRVNHKAFIEVNEQGTEAAAATFIDIFACFAQGTPVLTPDGEKPIEELKPGDLVLSRNEHNVEGEVQPKLVEQTFQRHAATVSMHIGGHVIRTTNEHPFFVKGRGWTRAGELRVGDLLATDLGSWKEVEKVAATGEDDVVYNLRVADHHTYFVGSKAWGFAVWTHNLYGATEFRADHPFHYFIRDNATSTILFMGRFMDPTQGESDLEPTVESAPIDPLPGDTDGDDDVDFADFAVLAQNFGKKADAVFAEGDFNGDGAIDLRDFVILQGNFGKTRESFESSLEELE